MRDGPIKAALIVMRPTRQDGPTRPLQTASGSTHPAPYTGPTNEKTLEVQGLIVVPEVGLEPTRPRGPGPFEGPAYTDFATPARGAEKYHERPAGPAVSGLARCVAALTAGVPPGSFGPLWGCSSAGRAQGWQSWGRGFDSPQLHQAFRGVGAVRQPLACFGRRRRARAAGTARAGSSAMARRGMRYPERSLRSSASICVRSRPNVRASARSRSPLRVSPRQNCSSDRSPCRRTRCATNACDSR